MSRGRQATACCAYSGFAGAAACSGDGASSVGLQNGNGVDPARARVSATRERVAAPASKDMALSSARSSLAACDGSGLWLSRRHPPAGAAPYRNAGAESGARAASAGRSPQRGQGDQALRRPQGKTPRHGRSSNGWRARVQGIRCQRPTGQSAARFRSARRSTPAGRGHQLREWFPRDRRLRACGTPGSRTGASRAGNDCDACSLAMSKGQEPFGSLQWTPGASAASTTLGALPPPSAAESVCLRGR
jgi:hypothetical protein